MKKILLLMAIILPFVLTSCGDDKDEPKQNLEQELIGSWTFAEGSDIYTILFNSNHTGKSQRMVDGHLVQDTPFTWSLNGNVLTVVREVTVIFKISVEGDVLTTQQEVDGEVIKVVYHRAKG